MARSMFNRVFSMKTLVRVAFAALSLSAGVASAQSTNPTSKLHSPDDYNYTRGGGNS